MYIGVDADARCNKNNQKSFVKKKMEKTKFSQFYQPTKRF